MAVHPCRARRDTFTNPHFKMHAYADDGKGLTLCGLEVRDFDDPESRDWRFAYASVCPSCFPADDHDPDGGPPPQDPWDDEHPDNRGDVIGVRGDPDPRGPQQSEA